VEEVRRQLSTGDLLPTDQAWTEGAANWAPLSSLPGVLANDPATPSRSHLLPPEIPGAPAVPGPATGGPQTPGTAIASLIFGILSVTCLPIIGSIVAVICGHVAHGSIRTSGGRLAGSGLATAGLVLGYGGLALTLFVLPVLAGIALPVFSQVQVKAKETRSMSNAKQLVLACKLYALDNRGAFPPKLEELVPKYLPDKSVLVCPLSPTLPLGYQYYGGVDSEQPTKVVLMSKFADGQHKRVIAYADGSCAMRLPPPDLPAPVEP
jgi:hypothetical protein